MQHYTQLQNHYIETYKVKSMCVFKYLRDYSACKSCSQQKVLYQQYVHRKKNIDTRP